MVRLKHSPGSPYTARKRLPADVREEYGRLWGPSNEAKFYRPPHAKKQDATRDFGAWLAEVEGRISAIREARNGGGRTLTLQQAHALAGEWYEWFVARHSSDPDDEELEHRREQVQTALRHAVTEDEAERFEPDELWRRPEVRDSARPVLADLGETAQFLAAKGVALTVDARDLFLDSLYRHYAAALRYLIRVAGGDFKPDAHRKSFPRPAPPVDSGETPWQLFELWIAKKRPAQSSITSWRTVFRAMTKHFEGRSAASITPEEANAWIQGLINDQRKPHVVKKTWLTASRTVFALAVRQKALTASPFDDVTVELPRRQTFRDTPAFHQHEWRAILKAASAVTDVRKPDHAASRWLPWLCAYTGTRPSEPAQLRKSDVIERGGIHALRLTPEAGTIKIGETRVVPIHEHLLEQGFLEFVAGRPAGPLFYTPRKTVRSDDPTRPTKGPWFQAANRLAAWVRETAGITDPHVRPSHAWRHVFKQIGRRSGIAETTLDDICGHAHDSQGSNYGPATLDDMAAALKLFPRYEIGGS